MKRPDGFVPRGRNARPAFDTPPTDGLRSQQASHPMGPKRWRRAGSIQEATQTVTVSRGQEQPLDAGRPSKEFWRPQERPS